MLLYLAQSVSRPMSKRGREKHLSEGVATCLPRTKASRREIVQIWNAAKEDTSDRKLSKWNAEKAETERLRPIVACFDQAELPDAKQPEVKHLVWIANISRTLRWLAQTNAWCEMLVSLTQVSTDLQLVLYNDEVQGGNILAPEKKKKALCVYACLKGTDYHNESCWITLCCIQSYTLERIQGGLSGVLCAIVKSLHSAEHQRGFRLTLNGVDTTVRLRSPSLLISDHDAQRATYSVKGSEGMLPCISCCNVLNKNVQTTPPEIVNIGEANYLKFIPRTDQAYFDACAAIEAEGSKTKRATLEKANGIKWLLGALLFDAEARQHLPPSISNTDVLHDYFSNGVASWECGALIEHLESLGMQRSDLLSAAQAAEWKKQFNGWRFLPSEIERMLGEKLYDSGGYKGQGIDCQFLVPLLSYYVELVADHVGELTPKLVSFRALARCCRELWKLRFRYQPIVDYEPVLELAKRQSEHQTTCLSL